MGHHGPKWYPMGSMGRVPKSLTGPQVMGYNIKAGVISNVKPVFFYTVLFNIISISI